MKRIKLLAPLALLSFLSPVRGQSQIQLLNKGEGVIAAAVDLAAEKVEGVRISNQAGALQISSATLSAQNGDLALQYQLPELEKTQYYQVSVSLVYAGKTLTPLPGQVKGDIGGPLATGGAQSLRWTGLLEDYLNIKGTVELHLKAELWGELVLPYGVNCNDPRPAFTGKQKVPYYIAAGVGVAAIGVGQLFRSQSEDTYSEYENAASLAEAQPLYEDANSQNQTYLLLTWSGAAVLAVDAVLYLVRSSKTRKKAEVYDEFCNKSSFSLRPDVEIPMRNPGASPANGKVGMKLTFSFR